MTEDHHDAYRPRKSCHAVASSVVLKDGQVVTREIKDNKKNTKNYLVFFYKSMDI